MFPELPDAKIEIRNPIASPSAPTHPAQRQRSAPSRFTAPNLTHHRIATNRGQRRNSENVEIVTLSLVPTLSVQRVRVSLMEPIS